MKVGLLTEEQKNLLIGVEIKPKWYYNPVQDCNGDWIISKEEIINTTNQNYDWVFGLPDIDWCAPAPQPPTLEMYVGS